MGEPRGWGRQVSTNQQDIAHRSASHPLSTSSRLKVMFSEVFKLLGNCGFEKGSLSLLKFKFHFSKDVEMGRRGMDKGLRVHPFITAPVSSPCPCQGMSDGQLGCTAKTPPSGGLGEKSQGLGELTLGTAGLRDCSREAGGWVPGCSVERAKNKFGQC